ncbi:GNAT family N-acetyltransferase [Streptomyces liangshanensis]|uniref:GNAT family N-acetyltransferase n=1 Tax=Streptomyces liangshanensis TaxID=2717324 RepID=A0A6G9H3G5_9ACTN|nr:GNAT family N-acetyltransferase [Streptomyces liangshanensis]QIQ05082.1 GNAT family N-acetyltransferase [Streptomyces liangshanensis]
MTEHAAPPTNRPASPTHPSALDRIDHYLDALPRRVGRAEDFGPLTLFVREDGGSPLQARPTRGWRGRPVTPADVAAVRARQRELGLPESFEWVHESAPDLRAAVEATDLPVTPRPLLVLPENAPTPPLADLTPEGVEILTVTPDAPWLPSAVATAHLAFANLGTHVGEVGPAELPEAEEHHATAITLMAMRIREGRTTLVAAVENGIALSSGLLPGVVDGITEICAVATLPTARRRGLALAVTATLIQESRTRGAHTIFLSATDPQVARIYTRLGFHPTATAMET